MTTGFVVFYGVAVALIFARAAARLLLSLGYPFYVRISASFSLVITIILLWPIPIHGGVTFTGEMLIDELNPLHQKHDEAIEKIEKSAFSSHPTHRFEGQLEITSPIRPVDGWQLVILRENRQAWFDPASALLWSKPALLDGGSTAIGIERAKAFCRDSVPAGFWALPTEAEQALMWQAASRSESASPKFSEISYLVDNNLRMEIPVFRVHGHRNEGSTLASKTAIRCVARGPGAPTSGYAQRDIPLDLWNRYQLLKLNPEA